MFGCAWVGLFAGLLPPATGRREVLMLAAYGALSGYFFGFMLNLSFWPFAVDPHSTISYLPGAPFATNVQRYLLYDATTSLGWDTGGPSPTCLHPPRRPRHAGHFPPGRPASSLRSTHSFRRCRRLTISPKQIGTRSSQ